MADVNEFRKSIVSQEWVLFSTARKHSIRKFADVYQSKQDCPFEDFAASGNEVLWSLPDADHPEVILLANKYPSVTPGVCQPVTKVGMVDVAPAVGAHDLFVFRDHDTRLYDFSPEQMTSLVRAYKKRYKELAELNECVAYIAIFHNYGKDAGASLFHPHSQIMALPIVPPIITSQLRGAEVFFKHHHQSAFDKMLEWETATRTRVIEESQHFVAVCPFASHHPYEIKIFPKQTTAHFEAMPDEQDEEFALILRSVLRRIYLALDNAQFNYFIHTAPVHEDCKDYYGWHLEIIPKIKIDAGFELGSGMGLNVVDPDVAAALLRDVQP